MFKLWNARNLSTRLGLLALGLLLLVITANCVLFVKSYRENALAGMAEKAASFTATADQTKVHVSRLHAAGSFDKPKLMQQLAEVRAAGQPYEASEIFKTVPVVSGWTAAKAAAEQEKLDFAVPSFNARNPKNSVEPASFRGKLLTDVTASAEAERGDTLARIDPQNNSLHFMRAIRLTQDCLQCHGDPPAGSKAGEDILGFKMEGWKAGQVHGAYEVIMPLAPLDAKVRTYLAGALLVSLLLLGAAGGVYVWFLRRNFARPVQQMLGRMRLIAAGDLSQRVPAGEDELGRLGHGFNEMVGQLSGVIHAFDSNAQEVASAATEVAASSEQMASTLADQHRHVDQIFAAIDQMASSVSDVARHTAEAVSQARAAGAQAAEGGDVVRATISGMSEIDSAVAAGAKSVTELGQRSTEIGQIINVINEIADQTNLLALNAAIEAARAGEHGRGFAVVADEVRRLADRTTDATGQVAQAIRAIQSETDEAVEQMHHGTEQVRDGVQRTRAAGDSLEAIVGSSRNVAQMIESIAAATEEQSAAGEEIQRSLEQMLVNVKQTSEGASQAAQAAVQLSLKSEELQGKLQRFKL